MLVPRAPTYQSGEQAMHNDGIRTSAFGLEIFYCYNGKKLFVLDSNDFNEGYFMLWLQLLLLQAQPAFFEVRGRQKVD